MTKETLEQANELQEAIETLENRIALQKEFLESEQKEKMVLLFEDYKDPSNKWSKPKSINTNDDDLERCMSFYNTKLKDAKKMILTIAVKHMLIQYEEVLEELKKKLASL